MAYMRRGKAPYFSKSTYRPAQQAADIDSYLGQWPAFDMVYDLFLAYPPPNDQTRIDKKSQELWDQMKASVRSGRDLQPYCHGNQERRKSENQPKLGSATRDMDVVLEADHTVIVGPCESWKWPSLFASIEPTTFSIPDTRQFDIATELDCSKALQ